MFVRLGPAGRKKKSLSLSVSLNVGLSANPPPPHTLDNVGEFFRAGNSLFRSLLFCSKSLIFHIFHVFDSFSQISPFFKPKNKSLFIKSKSEQIAPVALYKRATVSNSLSSLMTKEQRERYAIFHQRIALLLTKNEQQKTSN